MNTESLKTVNSWALWAMIAMSLGPLAVMPIASKDNLAQQATPAQYGIPEATGPDAPMGPEGAAV